MNDASPRPAKTPPANASSPARSEDRAGELAQSLGLTPDRIEERLDLMGLTREARQDLRSVAGAVAEDAEGFVEQLYDRLLRSPSTAKWFHRAGTVERLKHHQRRYLSELFSAPIDRDYVLRRLQIGVVHHRVRLTPRWYMATCAHFVCAHVPRLLHASADARLGMERIVTLLKTVLFDASLVLDAYGMSLEQSLLADQRSAREPESHEEAKMDHPPRGPEPDAGPPQLFSRLHLTDDDCGERQSFLGIDDATCRTLREMTPLIREVLPEMLEGFYGAFRRWPATRALLPEAVVERLVKQVTSYWLELSQAKFDRPYAASRTRIGIVHERVGVTAPIYLTGLARQVGSLLQAIARQPGDPTSKVTNLVKGVMFDASFVLDAYMDTRATSVLRHEGYASQLLANLTMGVAVLDPQHRVNYANAALLHQLGVEAGIVRHMPAADLLADPRIDALLSQVASNPGAKRYLRTEFGGRQLRVTLFQLVLGVEDSGQAPLALLVEDLTEASSATPEVRQLERGLEAVVCAVDAVLWEADPREWIFTMVSSPVLALTGFRDMYFLGRPGAWTELLPVPDRERFLRECAQLQPRQSLTIVHRLITASGAPRWVRTHVARSGADDGSPLLSGVSLDVSDSFLEEKRRLEAVGRLAGAMAHEINGVLAIISGSLGLIADFQVPEQIADIQSANEAVRRGAALTRRLQIFAQGAPLRPLPTNLNALIHSGLPEVRLAAGPATELRFVPSPALWMCSIDHALFLGALLDLVANARESMLHGGHIQLLTRNVRAEEIDLAADVGSFADHVEVAVHDAGTGMDDEVRARATEPCFTTKPDAQGLGLSMVYGFVHQSRGHLVIESHEGRGSTVRLRFPRSTAAGTSAPGPATAGTSQRRVLVVDDDAALGSLLQRLLVRQGFAVQVAQSPDEARRLVEIGPPDVLLCDVLFHGEAVGAELGRELRTRYPTLPVIYMSGFTKTMLHLQPDERFISKPFQLPELYALLEQAFSGK